MKIKFNEVEKSIEIEDGLKTHYFMMKLLMILNLVNAVLNLYDVNETGFRFIEIVWLVLGIASLVILYLYTFRKSSSVKIPIDTIEQIEEKSVFGRTRISIQLKNGKNRDLNEIKTQSEINELKHMFNEIGIAS